MVEDGGADAYPILTPQQTRKVDLAIDDGAPLSGKFFASNSNVDGVPDCRDSASAYNLDETAKACYFNLKLD
jgi:hypothetical protein